MRSTHARDRPTGPIRTGGDASAIRKRYCTTFFLEPLSDAFELLFVPFGCAFCFSRALAAVGCALCFSSAFAADCCARGDLRVESSAGASPGAAAGLGRRIRQLRLMRSTRSLGALTESLMASSLTFSRLSLVRSTSACVWMRSAIEKALRASADSSPLLALPPSFSVTLSSRMKALSTSSRTTCQDSAPKIFLASLCALSFHLKAASYCSSPR
mmetsp:Transcript_32073/g.87875  ORF Transcript_32073/g.87875 Transcript_32073/m.87875 type:complete len:214 (-) Transcript_32073:1406-2047(-)